MPNTIIFFNKKKKNVKNHEVKESKKMKRQLFQKNLNLCEMASLIFFKNNKIKIIFLNLPKHENVIKI